MVRGQVPRPYKTEEEIYNYGNVCKIYGKIYTITSHICRKPGIKYLKWKWTETINSYFGASCFGLRLCVELRRYGLPCCDVTTEAASGVWFIIIVKPLSSYRPPTQRRWRPRKRMTKNGNLERVMRLTNIKGHRTWHVNHVTWDRARVRYIKLEQGVHKLSRIVQKDLYPFLL
jgi:hypothetical protein